MKLATIRYLYFLLFIFIFFSCYHNVPFQNSNNDQSDDNNNELFEEDWVSEFTQEDCLFKKVDNSDLILNVVDEKYWTSQGTTIWTTLDEVPSVSEVPFETTIKKTSGAAEAGYGIHFATIKTTDSINMLIFLINIKGEYAIGELKGKNFRYYKTWTKCQYLAQGYDKNNKLKITFENSYRYAFYINNNFIQYLYNPGYTSELQGKNGLIAVVSPKDKLPDQAVTVIYTLE